jgi:hypothetical protein
MNRYPYRKGSKKRPTLKAVVEHRPPNPGRTSGGIGWEYVYPAPPEERHEYPEPDEEPGRYDTTPGNVWNGEGP